MGDTRDVEAPGHTRPRSRRRRSQPLNKKSQERRWPDARLRGQGRMSRLKKHVSSSRGDIAAGLCGTPRNDVRRQILLPRNDAIAENRLTTRSRVNFRTRRYVGPAVFWTEKDGRRVKSVRRSIPEGYGYE